MRALVSRGRNLKAPIDTGMTAEDYKDFYQDIHYRTFL